MELYREIFNAQEDHFPTTSTHVEYSTHSETLETGEMGHRVWFPPRSVGIFWGAPTT